MCVCVCVCVYIYIYFFFKCAMCKTSMYCKEISDNMPEDGAPITNPSFWIIILFLLVK